MRAKRMEKCKSSTKTCTERKVTERNRRKNMKGLYCKLFSLLPQHTTEEVPSLPDRVCETINYIKSLQMKLERMKEKKESLTKKRPVATANPYDSNNKIDLINLPEIKIQEMGNAVELIFTAGLNVNHFLLYDFIRLLCEDDSIDVVNASSSVVRNSIFYIIHAEVRDSSGLPLGFGAERISKRLNEFFSRSVGEEESESQQLRFCDLEIDPDIWHHL